MNAELIELVKQKFVVKCCWWACENAGLFWTEAHPPTAEQETTRSQTASQVQNEYN